MHKTDDPRALTNFFLDKGSIKHIRTAEYRSVDTHGDDVPSFDETFVALQVGFEGFYEYRPIWLFAGERGCNDGKSH